MIDYTNSDMQTAINECIHSKRDREILTRRLIDGIRFEPLAIEFDLTPNRVKTIVYKSQDKLFRYLELKYPS